jgi:hypothetical protein
MGGCGATEAADTDRGDVSKGGGVHACRAAHNPRIGQGHLERVIEVLCASLEQASEGMQRAEGQPANLAKVGALVARLSHALIRALLARDKLAAADRDITTIKARLDRVLCEMGLGEEQEA